MWLLLFISARLGPAAPPVPAGHGFAPILANKANHYKERCQVRDRTPRG